MVLGDTRVCAVVLEANTEVNEKSENLHPAAPKPLYQFPCRFKYITISSKGFSVQNFI